MVVKTFCGTTPTRARGRLTTPTRRHSEWTPATAIIMKIRQWQQQVYGKTGHGLDEHGRDLSEDVHRRRHLGIETMASSPTVPLAVAGQAAGSSSAVSPAVAGQAAYPAQQAPRPPLRCPGGFPRRSERRQPRRRPAPARRRQLRRLRRRLRDLFLLASMHGFCAATGVIGRRRRTARPSKAMQSAAKTEYQSSSTESLRHRSFRSKDQEWIRATAAGALWIAPAMASPHPLLFLRALDRRLLPFPVEVPSVLRSLAPAAVSRSFGAPRSRFGGTPGLVPAGESWPPAPFHEWNWWP